MQMLSRQKPPGRFKAFMHHELHAKFLIEYGSIKSQTKPQAQAKTAIRTRTLKNELLLNIFVGCFSFTSLSHEMNWFENKFETCEVFIMRFNREPTQRRRAIPKRCRWYLLRLGCPSSFMLQSFQFFLLGTYFIFKISHPEIS